MNDIVALIRRAVTKVNTTWLRSTYPFAIFGKRVSVDLSCDISSCQARFIELHDGVFLARDVWLNAESSDQLESKIILGPRCKIGRRSTISSKNRVEMESDVLLAPSVLVMDHNHEYGDPDRPIYAQGTTPGGRILIQRNCWLGHGSVILCTSGELVLGRNSIVAANSVVTRSVPPFSIVGGNPATLIKQYDENARKWVRVAPRTPAERSRPGGVATGMSTPPNN